MRIPRGGLRPRMPQQLADYWQPLTRGNRDESGGVTQVMDAHVLQTSTGTQPLTEVLEVGERLAG